MSGQPSEVERVREVGQALFDALVVCWNGDCAALPHQAKTRAALYAWKYDICGGHPPDPSSSVEGQAS